MGRLLGLLALVAFPVVCAAQDAAVTPSAQFEVQFVGGQTVYRQGDAILLDLVFRGRGGGDAFLSTQSYD